jgi:hypothetical protein
VYILIIISIIAPRFSIENSRDFALATYQVIINKEEAGFEFVCFCRELKTSVHGFKAVTWPQIVKHEDIDLTTISTLKITAFEIPQRPSDSTNSLFACRR